MSAAVDWPEEPLGAAEFAPTVLDAAHAPDAVAAWSSAAEPGADVLVAVTAIRAGSLSAAGQIDALTALRRQESWLAATQLRLLAEMSRTRSDRLGKDYLRDEVGCALRLSRDSAAGRLSLARTLAGHEPVLAALERGVISELHARVFVEETGTLAQGDAVAVRERVLPGAEGQTAGAFRRSVRRAVLTYAAQAAEERHLAARAQRRVAFRPVADGMEEMWALLPAEGAALLRARLNAMATHPDPHDTRTADQRRADALVRMALPRSSGSGDPTGGDMRVPVEHGLRPGVQVTVALSTLLELDEQPGELSGHGPIPASLARRIAADPTGTWRRLLTDERGRLLDCGRSSYRPPADLTRHVIARDRTCCHPGCSQPAQRCELDHCTPWADGGPTSAANLFALCARHHHLKHEAGWRYEATDDGDIFWTTPTGHTYLRPAATYPHDTTGQPQRPDPPPDPPAGVTEPPDDPDPPPF